MRVQRKGAWVYRDRRWPALRLMAKRRDGWACIVCGARHRLEVHHKEPVRDRPDLAFDLENLVVLCGSCHAKETRRELGFPELSPERQRWRELVQEMRRNQSSTIGE